MSCSPSFSEDVQGPAVGAFYLKMTKSNLAPPMLISLHFSETLVTHELINDNDENGGWLVLRA